MQERVIADKITSMLMIHIINKNHSLSAQMLHTSYFTDPWDRGIGWTIPCSPMIPWDHGMEWTIYGISGQLSICWYAISCSHYVLVVTPIKALSLCVFVSFSCAILQFKLAGIK